MHWVNGPCDDVPAPTPTPAPTPDDIDEPARPDQTGWPIAVLVLLVALLVSGWTGATGEQESVTPTAGGSSSRPAPSPRSEPDLDLAVSTPVEDSLYPDVGDPRVDALHYDLDLTWLPRRRTLQGEATVVFRATRTTRRFQLDLAGHLKVSGATLDGRKVEVRHRGKDLLVRAAIEEDQRYELALTYAGRPRPVRAPTTRSDFTTAGFTVTPAGEVWTMQEPYGAYSWYPVNDQPADKALYDITVHAPAPWTGVANGRLTSLSTRGGTTTSSWQLEEPASSYLITLAIGDYDRHSNTTGSGLRIDYWVPRGFIDVTFRVKRAAPGIDWLESRLGPYPFDTLGVVVTASDSAMETQTMVTLGSNEYVLSPEVIVHELAHQWFGDQVSPADWSDVWLNEGMAMLLQWLWEDEYDAAPFTGTVEEARLLDQGLRDQHGPPGAYDPAQFGSSNVYYPPALMWNELREELGDEEFFRISRAWLAAHDNQATTRKELYAHWETETGRELAGFFDAWIMGASTPAHGVPAS